MRYEQNQTYARVSPLHFSDVFLRLLTVTGMTVCWTDAKYDAAGIGKCAIADQPSVTAG